MHYRIPELDDIGQRIQQIIEERNPNAKLVQVSPEKARDPTTWNPMYRNTEGSEYAVFVAVPQQDAYVAVVDIEKGSVQRKLR